jgi:hypothetical protein
LSDALSEALARVDPAVLKSQITTIVPAHAQQILAAAGVRDEHVFPTPIVLETKPTLIGYYRLLLGAPQKSFYHGRTGLGRFKSMEMDGVLRETQRTTLPAFCEAMSKPLADLVVQVSPQITARDVAELPLITLGSFFQGQNNVQIGKQATKDVFIAIADIVQRFVVERDEQKLIVKNASGRTVRLVLASPKFRLMKTNIS